MTVAHPPGTIEPPKASAEVAQAPDPEVADGPRPGNRVPEIEVTAMFDDIAPIYDRMNTLMTLGLDARWRQEAVRNSGLSSGDSAIDVACGTGKLAAALAERVGPFGNVLAVDLSPRMIELARGTYGDLVQLEFRVGNALELPAGDGEFDAATIAFGVRNLADFEAGFRELARVVRPGGRVVCLELSLPRPRVWGHAYHAVFRRFAPFLGSMFRRKAAYRYLPESLEGFPDAEALAEAMRHSGLEGVSYRRLGLGAVALHVGTVHSTG